MRSMLRIVPLVVAILSCTERDSAGGSGLRTERVTAGDTTIVRTLGGNGQSGARTLAIDWRSEEAGIDEMMFGAIGEIALDTKRRVLVLDSRAGAVRLLDAEGKFLRTVGRRGQGPGEYTGVRGITVLPDNRFVILDDGSGRLNVYDDDGEPVTGWSVRGADPANIAFSRALHSDTAGLLYIQAAVTPRLASDIPLQYGLLRFDPRTLVPDSLGPPVLGDPVPYLTASSGDGRSQASRPHPFAATDLWAWSPLGYFVAARSDRYAIHLAHPDGRVLRIERDLTPPEITSDERDYHIESVNTTMRRAQPDWTWNAAPFPGRKPYFHSLSVGIDGRIWAALTQPSVRAEIPGRSPPETVRTVWREETQAHDVFETDGSYLGQVVVPPRATIHVREGDLVWGVLRDDDDVPSVVRWRVTPGFGTSH